MGVWSAVTCLYMGSSIVWDFSQIYWFILSQVLLPGCVGAVAYFLFRGLYDSKRIGILASIYVATCPSDSLGATLILALLLFFALQYWDDNQATWWQMVALCLCGAMLAVGVYFYPFLVIALVFFAPLVAGKSLAAWGSGGSFWKTLGLSVLALILPFVAVLWSIHIPMGLAMKLQIFSQSYLFLVVSNVMPLLDWNTIIMRLFLVWPMHWAWVVPFGLGYIVVFFAMIRNYGPRTMILHWYLILLLLLWIFGGIAATALATMIGLCYLLTTLLRRGHPIPFYLTATLLFTVRIAIQWLWLI